MGGNGARLMHYASRRITSACNAASHDKEPVVEVMRAGVAATKKNMS